MSTTKVTWNSRPALHAADAGGEEGLELAGHAVLERANHNVPLMFGTLRDSGRVTVEGGTAVVSYDTAYAAILHEHPEYNFENGRTGKWLEKATKDGQGLMMDKMGEGLRKHF